MTSSKYRRPCPRCAAGVGEECRRLDGGGGHALNRHPQRVALDRDLGVEIRRAGRRLDLDRLRVLRDRLVEENAPILADDLTTAISLATQGGVARRTVRGGLIRDVERVAGAVEHMLPGVMP